MSTISIWLINRTLSVLPLRARVDLGAMTMNGYSTFPKAPALFEPHNQIVYCHKQDTRWEQECYTSLGMHSVYSTAPGGWTENHVNAYKTEYECFNWTGDISTLKWTSLKLVDKFTYLGSSFSSTEKDIYTRLTKAWTAIHKLSMIWKSNLTDKMKRSFFQVAVVLILLYGCTTWTLTKRLEKKLDGNYTRILRAILNKTWWQHPTKHQLYGHLLPNTRSIQLRRTRHAGHCWRNRDKLISDVLLWTPTYGRAKAGRPARTYIQQLCEDTACSLESLPEAMNDREKWRERVRDIRASGMTW